MSTRHDGPQSPLFQPITLRAGLSSLDQLDSRIPKGMVAHLQHVPAGACIAWGIPFDVSGVALLSDQVITVSIDPIATKWLVFLHTSEVPTFHENSLQAPCLQRGEGRLGEHVANYVILFDDGEEVLLPIRRRHQVGAFQRRWGENCFEAVADQKPQPSYDTDIRKWGRKQTRVIEEDTGAWVNWLWAWQNPHPEKKIIGLRCEPVRGVLLLFAMSAGNVSALPLRWRPRRKAVLAVDDSTLFRAGAREHDPRPYVQLDMGQIIACVPRMLYRNDTWLDETNNHMPEASRDQVVIEYAAHEDACFHFENGRVIPVARVEDGLVGAEFDPINPSYQRIRLRAHIAGESKPVAVRLHVHGEAGEYLSPVDRNHLPNPGWFEDYSVDIAPLYTHYCTYIRGETVIDLPIGRVYVEVSKGFEFKAVRRVFEVTPATRDIEVVLEKALPWREMGWVTADTHVHFLSPVSAQLEGAAEGINVVNLLASQWGELMTNVGDFDGLNTWGSKEAGGDGEHLVRVGSENRQHVLGHISLLGYRGNLITPLAVGGPDESGIGDPVEILVTEWARQCRNQGGLVVVPHFPDPRAEHAAAIVDGSVDAVEMTSFSDLYGGIDPYSLADWYRYLNCGYHIPVVAGTDKMSATTPVGAVRTYARIRAGREFSYEEWQEAVRRGETFVTYGPLLEFSVDGHPMGDQIELGPTGGTLDVSWHVASVTTPLTRVELVVNGETRESIAVSSQEDRGNWSIRVDRSCWLALLVRARGPSHRVQFPFLDPWLALLINRRLATTSEIIAAHSSAVMAHVRGQPLFARADAVTILEQIEGALAYVETVGTRAEDLAYKRMRLVLEGIHRRLHERLHQHGVYHEHTIRKHHSEHQ